MLKTYVLIVFSSALFVLSATVIQAQTINPSSWQTDATGLKTQDRSDKKTAGLGFIVEQRAWPFLYAMGGAEKSSYSTLGDPLTSRLPSPPTPVQPSGIELGQIEAGGAGGFVSEETDWAHNTLMFNGLKLYTSRLSPAVVVESSASSLQLFTGTVNGFQYTTSASVSAISRTSSPKYVAYPTTSGSVSVKSLSALVDLSDLNTSQNWLLVWYGDNSHFIDSKIPSTYGDRYAIVPESEGYQADISILLKFENKPTSIKQGTNGGIELSFSGASGSGHITILPLLGSETLKSSDTESWGTNATVPGNILTNVTFWKERLCQFPYKVAEDYAYDSGTDTTTITENVTFMQTCASTTKFAPFSPMLALAKDAFGNQFSVTGGTLKDASLATEFGPLWGIDNPTNNRYTWSLTGLNKYIAGKRQMGTGVEPPELKTELASEINKIKTAGHYAPWIFIDRVKDANGDIYWANPADSIYHLTEIAEALPDGPEKDNFIDYIKSERNLVKPEDVYHLDYTIQEGLETITCTPACTSRGEYVFYGKDAGYTWANKKIVHTYARAFYKRVPLYNFYSLARYYDLTQDTTQLAEVISQARTVLNLDMQNHDWATMYWFDGYDQFYGHPEAAHNTNRHFAGLVGFNRLVTDDTQATHVGRGLLAKAAVLRVAMAKYPRYLYEKNLASVPQDPAWMPKYLANNGWGEFYNYNWTGPYDDPRQVHIMNQFGLLLQERFFFTGRSRTFLFGLRDMMPELARLLSDAARQDIDVYIEKFTTLFPYWYAVFMDAQLGAEHGQNHPVDAYQMFLGKAWIQKEPADNLKRYRDITQLSSGGDLFYVHKLAETIKAYQGWSWSGQGACTLLGDVNQDASRDLSDVIRCIRYLVGLDALTGTELTAADANQDGSVDLSDVIRIIRDLLGLEPLPACQ